MEDRLGSNGLRRGMAVLSVAAALALSACARGPITTPPDTSAGVNLSTPPPATTPPPRQGR